MNEINLAARNGSIDVLRGIGILLVVYAHAARGVFNAGLYTNETAFQVIDKVIYSFHMPLFFFLSGLVFAPRLSVPRDSFVKHSLVRLLWPLVLWTYVFLFLRALAGPATNTDSGMQDLLVLPLPPVLHLWFLWALFLIHIITHAALAGWNNASARSVFLAAFCASLLLLAVLPPLPDPLGPLLRPCILHLPYFLLGLLCAGLIVQRQTRASVGLIGALAFLGAVFALSTTPVDLLGKAVLTCIAVLSLSLSVASVEPYLRGARVWTVLQVLGLASMVIYLMHTIFSAGLRIGLEGAGITDTSLHLALGTAIGIVVPALLWRVTYRRRAATVLGFA